MSNDTSLGGVIVLTKDPKILAELEEKLGQYRVRLKLNDDSLPCVDAKYKKKIISELLGEGAVDIEEMRKKCMEEFGEAFRADLFSNAVLVIGTYNEMGLPNLDQQEMNNNFSLSQDPLIQQRLRAKLAYYQSKMDSGQLTGEEYSDTYHKYSVLNELLEAGQIDGRELKKRFSAELGDKYNESDCNNALGVMFQYNAGTIAKLEIAES